MRHSMTGLPRALYESLALAVARAKAKGDRRVIVAGKEMTMSINTMSIRGIELVIQELFQKYGPNE